MISKSIIVNPLMIATPKYSEAVDLDDGSWDLLKKK